MGNASRFGFLLIVKGMMQLKSLPLEGKAWVLRLKYCLPGNERDVKDDVPYIL